MITNNLTSLIKVGIRFRFPWVSKGITQQGLAAACNFEKANMSSIEAGRTNPTVSTLYKISQGLGISIFDLVDVG